MARRARKKADPKAWLETYSDMITLVLCFFVVLMGDPSKDESRIQLILAAFGGLGPLTGGMTLSPGDLAVMGASLESLPSEARAKALEKARDKAQSLLKTQDETLVRSIVMVPERGLVITLVGDALFRPGSAEVDIERTRSSLQDLAKFFNSPETAGSLFRIEGYAASNEPSDQYPTYWELSTARATNILHYLVSYGANDRRFQVAGFGDTRPAVEGNTPEANAYNRRVEIVVLSDGHL